MKIRFQFANCFFLSQRISLIISDSILSNNSRKSQRSKALETPGVCYYFDSEAGKVTNLEIQLPTYDFIYNMCISILYYIRCVDVDQY